MPSPTRGIQVRPVRGKKSGAQGIQGVKGDKGETGAKGDVGPTYGAVGGGAFIPSPPFAGSINFATMNVNLPRPGSLFVTGRVRGALNCGAGGSCTADYGLYLDDVLIPNAASRLEGAASSSQSNQHLTMFGIVNTSAGPHTVKFNVLPGGSWAFVGFAEREIAGVLLGGSVAVAGTTTSSPMQSLTR
jgi:hypothetical protein